MTPITSGWSHFELLNIEKVRTAIKSFAPHVLGIFSFAIHDDTQLELFNVLCRPYIEQALGVKLNIVLTVDGHISSTCARQMGIHPSRVDFEEMSAFWGKQGAFRLVMHNRAEQWQKHLSSHRLHFLLLDDVVTDEVTTLPRLRTIIEQRNIDTL